MEKPKNNKGGISDTDLDALKKKYPGLKCGSIEDLASKDGDRLYFYFTKPDADVFSRAAAHMMDRSIKAAQLCFYTNAVKWAQEGIAEGAHKDEHMYSVGKFIGNTFKIAEGQEEDF